MLNYLVRLFIPISCIAFSFASCSQHQNKNQEQRSKKHKITVIKPFSGDYNKDFNDMPDLHKAAAQAKGILPLMTRADTMEYAGEEDKLIRIPSEVELYKLDELKYSIPFLVPDAAQLLVDISKDFRDSLIRKKMPLYRLIVTSVTRTGEDLEKLMKRNRNAVPESTHQYGTTFDISWKRFDKVLPQESKNAPTDRLKYTLALVLYNLKNEDRCYVKHERRQACFHITVR